MTKIDIFSGFLGAGKTTLIKKLIQEGYQGEKLVLQRGAAFCTVKSTPEREQAAVTFLKWITEPQRNVEFVTQVGYMPV